MHIKLARKGVRDTLLLCLIALMGSMLIQPAEARKRHARIASPTAAIVVCNNDGRCEDRTTSAPTSLHHAVALATSRATAPSRYIAGRLVCAVNVNAALAERGIRGTGSAMAKSFLGWGRASPPVPGAVAVYNRGRGKSGHVNIVSRVENGQVFVWNPGRRGWREVAYRKHAIAYRVPS